MATKAITTSANRREERATGTALHKLYETLGDTFAQIFEHPACPVGVYNFLTDVTLNLDNEANARRRDISHARDFVPHLLTILTEMHADEEDEQMGAVEGDDAVWDFSKAFVFEPAEEAEIGDLVLIRRGQSFTITPYDGHQAHLGTVTETETWDLTGPAPEWPADAPLVASQSDADAAHKRLDEANQRYIQDRERFVAAVWQRLSPEENEQAWREYSALCAKVMAGGRLWTPEFVWILTVVFRLIEADMEESENGASNEYPSLKALAGIVEMLGEGDVGRRLAGYLTDEAQPFPVAA